MEPIKTKLNAYYMPSCTTAILYDGQNAEYILKQFGKYGIMYIAENLYIGFDANDLGVKVKVNQYIILEDGKDIHLMRKKDFEKKYKFLWECNDHI